jgi:hypothetical protein
VCGRVRAAEFIRSRRVRCFWMCSTSKSRRLHCRQAGSKLVARCSCYVKCRGLSCMAGPLTGATPAARAMSRQRGWAQHPFWGLVLQCRGLSCMAGPLTGVMPAARATSRQRGMCWCYSAGDSAAWLVPSLVRWPLLVLCHGRVECACATVQGTQLHGWSSHWCDARCSCFVTAAW